MRYEEELINQIKQENDIVDVISNYVSLKKGGANYKGLCPFHSEKTPSFTVNPSKQIFHCFGCGEGGDILSFLMKKENIPFPEALRGLAERCGRTLPAEAGVLEDPARQKEKKRIFEMNRMATAFFLQACARNTAAQDYLKRRGVSQSTARVFSLGYAPDSWDGLHSHLKRQGFRDVEMERAGLVLPRRRGAGYYDRFRNRIIFPIIDIQERIIGFGGRVMDDSMPKYLNSPETLVFDKGANLYGIHLAHEAIRKQDYALLVEGYMDVIAAHQEGIRNVVATLGTALTQRHLKGLRRYTRNLALFFDSDDAGFKAAERCFDLCVPERVKVKVVTLAPGEDPDSFLKKSGRSGFSKKMAEARPIMDFMIHQVMGDEAPETLEGKVEATARLKPMLAAIADPIEQELYIKEVASRMGLEPATLKRTVLTVRGRDGSSGRNPEKQDEVSVPLRAMEGRFLGLLLNYPQVLPKIRKEIATEDISHPGLRAAVSRLLTLPEAEMTQQSLHTLVLHEDRSLESQLSKYSLEAENTHAFNLEAEAEGFVRSLRVNRLKRKQRDVQREIEAAEKAERHDEVKTLLAQLNDLRNEIEKLIRFEQTTVRADGRSHTA